MASIYDKSSLVLIPSGTKTGKVYSQKPVSGDGDFTFTRASAATRVNADGFIEKERGNRMLNSNDFNQWAKLTNGTYTITTETITDPFGNSVSLAKVTLTSGTYLVLRGYEPVQINEVTTASVYVKKTNATTHFEIDINDAYNKVAQNNTDWQRVVSTNYSTGYFLDISVSTLNQPVYIAYAQMESGLVATDYIPTTSAPVYVGITDNVPRLDYTDSSCPALLLEPQRTNLFPHSEYFADWITDAGEVLTANSIQSPEGVLNGYTLTLTNGAYQLNVYDRISITSGVDYVFSVWLKKKNTNQVQIYQYSINAPSGFVSRATIDFDAGTITDVDGSGATIEPYENGWFRCSVKCNAPSTLMQNGILTATIGVADVYAYGAQAELGSYATSYIPTYGSSVTRVNDGSLSLPISQTLNDFTLYWEGSLLQDGQNMLFGGGTGGWYLDVTGSNGRIVLDTNTGRKYQAFSTLRTGQTHKVAMKRTNGVIDAFVDGVKLTPTTQVTDTTALSLVSIVWSFSSTYYPKMNLNQVLTMQSALTDQEAIDLTTI